MQWTCGVWAWYRTSCTSTISFPLRVVVPSLILNFECRKKLHLLGICIFVQNFVADCAGTNHSTPTTKRWCTGASSNVTTSSTPPGGMKSATTPRWANVLVPPQIGSTLSPLGAEEFLQGGDLSSHHQLCHNRTLCANCSARNPTRDWAQRRRCSIPGSEARPRAVTWKRLRRNSSNLMHEGKSGSVNGFKLSPTSRKFS